MDADAWQAAGLYDPHADGAHERLALLAHLAARGVTLDQMVEADQVGRLPVAAAEPALRGGPPRYTLADAAALSGIEEGAFRRVWLADGFVDPGDAVVFNDLDVEAFSIFHAAVALVGEPAVLELARVYASAVARIAEAELVAVAEQVGGPLLDAGATELEVAASLEQLAPILPLLTKLLDVLHRHHIQAAIRRTAAAGMGLRRLEAELAVGFADLCGYTALSGRLPTNELAGVLRAFDALAADIVVAGGGRVVKLIGDEVMFVARDPTDACAIAMELRDRVANRVELPALRTGLAFGDVLVRDGDYYGPVVNRAARAVGKAEPGQVLADTALRHAVGDGIRFGSAGSHVLKGFDAPVQLFPVIGSEDVLT